MSSAQQHVGPVGFARKARKMLAVLVLAVGLGTPISVSAATPIEVQSLMVSTCMQVADLQKQMITTLEVEVLEIQGELSSARSQLTSTQVVLQMCRDSTSPTYRSVDNSDIGESVSGVAQRSTTAQGQTGGPSANDAEKQGGCWIQGTWYPEGSIYPPQKPGYMTGTVALSIGRKGRWVTYGR